MAQTNKLNIKRFDPIVSSHGLCDMCGADMEENSDGEFVLFDDVVKNLRDPASPRDNIFIIEEHNEDSVKFGIGFGSPNPNQENYFECMDYSDAKKLYDLITTLRPASPREAEPKEETNDNQNQPIHSK